MAETTMTQHLLEADPPALVGLTNRMVGSASEQIVAPRLLSNRGRSRYIEYQSRSDTAVGGAASAF